MADDRTLTVVSNGQILFEGCRIYVTGRSTMSCVPDVYQLDVYEADSTDVVAAKAADRLSVLGVQDSVVGYGKPTSVYVHFVGGRQVTSITLEDGGDLWASVVNVAMDKGATYRDAADLILLHSTAKVTLTAMPTDDTLMARGQVYHGRSIDALCDIARSLGARLWSLRDTLRMTRLGEQAEVRELSEDDLLETPASIDSTAFVLQTEVVGIQVGTYVDIDTDEARGQFLVVARSVSADSRQGPWKSEIIVINPNAFKGRWEGCY